jgi:hypothetical protein
MAFMSVINGLCLRKKGVLGMASTLLDGLKEIDLQLELAQDNDITCWLLTASLWFNGDAD